MGTWLGRESPRRKRDECEREGGTNWIGLNVILEMKYLYAYMCMRREN